MKLLIIEDEEELLETLELVFRKKGYATQSATDGIEGLEMAETGEYDLILLDLNLPGMDGIDILKRIRQNNPVQRILILTARSDFADRIEGLNLGANDYVVKPFDFGELIARVQNLLRRTFVQNDPVIEINQFRIDTLQRQVFAPNGRKLNLVPKEYAVLEYLAFKRGTPVSAEELIEHVWGDDEKMFSNAVKVQMSLLRKKLREHSGEDIIVTIRGVGYLIQSEE